MCKASLLLPCMGTTPPEQPYSGLNIGLMANMVEHMSCDLVQYESTSSLVVRMFLSIPIIFVDNRWFKN